MQSPLFYVTCHKVSIECLFILLRIDAGGILEVTAEIAGGGKTELEGSLLDRLFGIHVHNTLCLRRHILLYPFQGGEPVAILAE